MGHTMSKREYIHVEEKKKIMFGRLALSAFLITFLSLSFSKFDSDNIIIKDREVNKIVARMNAMKDQVENIT